MWHEVIRAEVTCNVYYVLKYQQIVVKIDDIIYVKSFLAVKLKCHVIRVVSHYRLNDRGMCSF